ncbi:hypothetical protein AVEN_167431-1 [Araneus ventricosus]|uniref:Transposable element Tc3 transposase n=1 Tax=Araneus ventricosus TaxID=182803 RepID=A0A4Y2EM58_ARAVE|nr:hypothetical protein AVEN_167431-1 [Araneus ventricosus]
MGHVMNIFCATSSLQHCNSADVWIEQFFRQDGAPSHIATPVMQLLNLHFGNGRIISRHLPKAWPPRSSDLNSCDFWLWGYLKDVVYGDPIANVRPIPELRNRITEHIHNITTETLRSVVEHAVLRFQLIGENDDQHIEHFLSKSKPTSFS